MKTFLILFLLGVLSISNILFPYEGDGNSQIMSECKTVKTKEGEGTFYNTTTKITFYGDSRMDYVNQGGIHGTRPNGDARTMADILNVPVLGQLAYTGNDIFQDNDIQNLGASGWTANQIRDHLERCLNNPNYRIANRFVYHAGGNNLRDAAIVLGPIFDISNTSDNRPKVGLAYVAMAIYFELVKRDIQSENDKIIGMLSSRASQTGGKKDVLVVGGYPTPFYFERSNHLPLNFFNKVGTFLTIGLYQIEGQFSEIASKYNGSYIRVWDVMSNITEIFGEDWLHPNKKGFDQWGSLVGSKLRQIGFAAPKTRATFTPTGDRWRDAETEYTLAKQAAEEALEFYLLKKEELKLRQEELRKIQEKIRDYEYKLSLIQKRIEKVDEKIQETRAEIASLDAQILEARRQGRLEEERRLEEQRLQQIAILAEQERERQRLEQERIQQEQQIAAQQAAAAAAAQAVAEAAAAAHAAQVASQQAIAAQQAAQAALWAEQERRRREEEQRNLLILCFIFGWCRL